MQLPQHPHNSEMPDLPIEDVAKNQKQVIKFWVEHCKRLEEQIDSLNQEIINLRKSTNQF